MSTRPRPQSTLPKPPTSLARTSTVADAASLTGTRPITVGAHATIHPRARLNSSHGPVTIGEACIVCEKASVGLLAPGADGDGDDDGVVLGPGVVVETAAVVEAARVGRGAVIEAGARVGRGAVLGEYCKIAPLCTVAPGEELPDFTVVYGFNERRQERPGLEGLRAKAHEKHVQVLKMLIPSNLAKWETGA